MTTRQQNVDQLVDNLRSAAARRNCACNLGSTSARMRSVRVFMRHSQARQAMAGNARSS